MPLRRTPRAAPWLALALAVAVPTSLPAQPAQPSAGYRNHAALTTAIDALRREHPRLVTVKVIATSPGGRAVHAVRLGAGANVDRRPAVMIMANAYGPHVVGSEIALGTMQRLAAGYGRDADVTALLDRATFYVIPRLNPDAAEAFFRRPLHERTFNELADDQDHDGVQDEDGPDDLNGDGFITMMRIADPSGEWRPDPTDPWLMRRADAVKGEAGGWRIMVEARDSDGDGEIGEDPPGGVDINRNFAHDYTFFSEGAGVHQFSSPEARAVAEFVYTHDNIAVAYVLGPQDNLMEPWRHRPQAGGPPQGTSAGGPLQSILRADEPWFVEISDRFKRSTGLTRNPPSVATGGDPATWMYYHMGRFSFASRGWWVPEAPRDSAAARPAGGGSGQGADPLAYERNAMKWLQATDPAAVLPWTAIQHPDFPGQTVEVGGFRPFALWNPPAALLDTVIARQHRFITELAGMLPSIELREAKAEPLGQGAWRITAQVTNTGYLPTLTALGPRARWPRQIRVDLKAGQGQTIVSGRAVQLLGPIQGSGRSTELSWVVTGSRGSTIELSAESPVAGSASTTITLR